MKSQKPKYKVAGIMLKCGEVKEFRDLENYVSKVNFGKAIGIGYKRMNNIFGNNIRSLSLGEILNTAMILQVDFNEILNIALKQFQKEFDDKGQIKIKLQSVDSSK
jgi:hypothetical protein